MPIVLNSILKKNPTIDYSKLDYSKVDETLRSTYRLSAKLEKTKREFDSISFRLWSFSSKVKGTICVNFQSNTQLEEIYNTVLSGLRLLSLLTNSVLEQVRMHDFID
jgi:hypothetical protein